MRGRESLASSGAGGIAGRREAVDFSRAGRKKPQRPRCPAAERRNLRLSRRFRRRGENSVTARRCRPSGRAASVARQPRAGAVNPSHGAVDSGRREVVPARAMRGQCVIRRPALRLVHESYRRTGPWARILHSRSPGRLRDSRAQWPAERQGMGSSTKRTEKGVGAAGAAPASSRASSTRALPIRSSPAGTTPSLRTKLTALKTPTKRARAASAPNRAKAKTPPFPRNPVLQELEPRLLMSADLNPLAHDTLLAAPALTGAEFRSLTDRGAPTVVTSAAVAPIQRTNELVFVDTATPDYQALIDSMRQSALSEGRNLEFVLIEADKDGIRKITDTLARKSDLAAIHIISHASDGSVQLGSAKLDFETLVKRAAAVKKWGSALTENGDILLYGCDLAATDKGKSLLEAMSRLTGADVAASDDL